MAAMRWIVAQLFIFSQLLLSSQPWRVIAPFRTATRCSVRMASIKYPTKIKSVVTKLTNSIQKSLQSRQSRIEVELPPAAEYGVEQQNGGNSKRRRDESDTQLVRRSNREAARLITEMFAVLGPSTTVLFPTEDEAQQARTLWGKQFKGQILAIDVKKTKGMGNLRSRRFSQQEQEAALLGDESGVYVPDGTEVLVFAGPRGKDLRKVMQVHERLGDDTLILLLNSRLAAAGADFNGSAAEENPLTGSAAAATEVSRAFVNAFHYAPPTAQDELLQKRELLLYHEFKGKWFLAEKEESSSSGGGGFMTSVSTALSGGSGGFITRWEGEQRPDESVIANAIDAKTGKNQ